MGRQGTNPSGPAGEDASQDINLMLQTLRDYDLDLTVLKDNEKVRKNPNKYSILDKLLLAEQIESRLRFLNN